MASLTSSVELEEFDFIEEPSRDFVSPVTLDLLRVSQGSLLWQPHLPRSYGNGAEEWLHVSPVQRGKSEVSALKLFKREVNELKVYCP